MIVDRQGRRFRNLRISLTSACNYACTYCVPNGKRLVAAQDELSAEAMARGVAYLIEAAGIERLRITGGEPLVSPKLEDVPPYFHYCAAWALVHGAVALYHSPFWSNVLEDQEGFFQFLMDIGVRMGNKRKRDTDTPSS